MDKTQQKIYQVLEDFQNGKFVGHGVHQGGLSEELTGVFDKLTLVFWEIVDSPNQAEETEDDATQNFPLGVKQHNHVD